MPCVAVGCSYRKKTCVGALQLLDILPVLMAVEGVDDVRAHLGSLVANLSRTQLQRRSVYGAS